MSDHYDCARRLEAMKADRDEARANADELAEHARQYRATVETLRAERDEARAEVERLREINESVAVCAAHVREVIGDGCLVCEAERAKAEAERLREALENMVGLFDNPVARLTYNPPLAEEARASARAALAVPVGGVERLRDVLRALVGACDEDTGEFDQAELDAAKRFLAGQAGGGE